MCIFLHDLTSSASARKLSRIRDNPLLFNRTPLEYRLIQPQRDCTRRRIRSRSSNTGYGPKEKVRFFPCPFPHPGSANACVAVQSRVGVSRCNSLPISRLYPAIAIIYIQYADFRVTGLRGSRRRDEKGTICAKESAAASRMRYTVPLAPSIPPLGEGGSFQVYEALVKLAAWKRARQEAKAFPCSYSARQSARDRAKFQIPRPH